MFVGLLVSMVIFFSELDIMYDKLNSMYPIPLRENQAIQSYMIGTFLLYMIPALFQGISFCAYAKELGLYLDYG